MTPSLLFRRLPACLALAAVLVTAGCGGAQVGTSSPNGPTPVAGAPAALAGATISGQVTSLGTAGPSTVAVVGTAVATSIDDSGRFVLSGVPSGDVRLVFTSAQRTETVLLLQVAVSEQIRLTLTLSDASGLRLEEERATQSQERLHLRSAVRAVVGSCPAISFEVDGITVTASEVTRFDGGSCSDVQPGAIVEADALRQAGTATATCVRILERTQTREELQIRAAVRQLAGACPDLAFDLEGTRVTTSAGTQFAGGTCARLRNREVVTVHGGRSGDGPLAASLVRLEQQGPR
jgi:hypothetical protein